MRRAPVLDGDLQPASGEGAGEHDLARVLADVDKAAGAGQPAAEAADVDIALGVRLRHAEAGHVQAAAVVEIELLVLLDHRVRIQRRAEIEPCLRHAADHAGLGGERQVCQYLLLRRHRRNTFGHADAEVHDAAPAAVPAPPYARSPCAHPAATARSGPSARGFDPKARRYAGTRRFDGGSPARPAPRSPPVFPAPAPAARRANPPARFAPPGRSPGRRSSSPPSPPAARRA